MTKSTKIVASNRRAVLRLAAFGGAAGFAAALAAPRRVRAASDGITQLIELARQRAEQAEDQALNSLEAAMAQQQLVEGSENSYATWAAQDQVAGLEGLAETLGTLLEALEQASEQSETECG